MSFGGHEMVVRVIVSGRVQGVWFRGWTVERATGLGLSGNVRNRRDGSVEAVLSGPSESVEAMLKALWRGPAAARVTGLEATPCNPPARLGFRQLPTG